MDLGFQVFIASYVGEEDCASFMCQVVDVESELGVGELVLADGSGGGGGAFVRAGVGRHGLLEVDGDDWHCHRAGWRDVDLWTHIWPTVRLEG